MEELGRGAFGKVHKGILKEIPRVEVFFKPREERVEINEGRVVAIKVLLGKKTQKPNSFPGSLSSSLEKVTFSREEERGPWERGCL